MHMLKQFGPGLHLFIATLIGGVVSVSSADSGENPLPKEPSPTELRKAFEGSPQAVVRHLEKKDGAPYKSLVPFFMKRMRSEDNITASAAERALEEIGRAVPESVVPRVVESLGQARGDENISRRLSLINLLRDIGQPTGGAPRVLTEELDADRVTLVYAAATALARIGESAANTVDRLMPLLEHRSPRIVKAAGEALMSIAKGAELERVVKKALRTDHQWLRYQALKKIKKHTKELKSVQPLLAKEIHANRFDYLLPLAAEALAAFGEPAPKAVPSLIKTAEDASGSARKRMSRALNTVKKNNVAPTAEEPDPISCLEGRSATVRLTVRDEDDLKPVLGGKVADAPKHGKVERIDQFRFRYHAAYGHPGKHTFTLVPTDGRKKGEPVTVTVNVRPDKTPPQLIGVDAFNLGNKITLVFDEPITSDSAQNTDNYQATGFSIKQARLNDAKRAVTLTLDKAMSQDDNFTLEVQNLSDRAKSHNTISKQKEKVTFWEKALTFNNLSEADSIENIENWEKGSAEAAQLEIITGKFGPDRDGVIRMDGGNKAKPYAVFHRDFDPPLSGHYIVEYLYREGGGNHRGSLWLGTSEGERLIAVGTDNPQWLFYAGNNRTVRDGKRGDDYDHWIRVTTEVDIPKRRTRVTFHDLDDGTKHTYGWFNIPKTKGIAKIGIGPSDGWLVDDIRIRNWQKQ